MKGSFLKDTFISSSYPNLGKFLLGNSHIAYISQNWKKKHWNLSKALTLEHSLLLEHLHLHPLFRPLVVCIIYHIQHTVFIITPYSPDTWRRGEHKRRDYLNVSTWANHLWLANQKQSFPFTGPFGGGLILCFLFFKVPFNFAAKSSPDLCVWLLYFI